MIVGFTPLDLGLLLVPETSLRRDLVLFDRLGFFVDTLERKTARAESVAGVVNYGTSKFDDTLRLRIAEMESLFETGTMFLDDYRRDLPGPDGPLRAALDRLLAACPDETEVARHPSEAQKADEIHARLSAIGYANRTGEAALPMVPVKGTAGFGRQPGTPVLVVRVAGFPVPAPSVPWPDVLALRQGDEWGEGLQRVMTEVDAAAREGYATADIAGRLEAALDGLRAAADRARLRHAPESFEMAFVADPALPPPPAGHAAPPSLAVRRLKARWPELEPAPVGHIAACAFVR